MRMSIALPIVAAFAAAAIGLSSPPPALAKGKKDDKVEACKAKLNECFNHCSMFTTDTCRLGCIDRGNAAANQCGGDVVRSKAGGGGVKVGGGKTGGVLTGNTNGGNPTPKAPVLGGSTGTNGGASPFLRRSTR